MLGKQARAKRRAIKASARWRKESKGNSDKGCISRVSSYTDPNIKKPGERNE